MVDDGSGEVENTVNVRIGEWVVGLERAGLKAGVGVVVEGDVRVVAEEVDEEGLGDWTVVVVVEVRVTMFEPDEEAKGVVVRVKGNEGVGLVGLVELVVGLVVLVVGEEDARGVVLVAVVVVVVVVVVCSCGTRSHIAASVKRAKLKNKSANARQTADTLQDFMVPCKHEATRRGVVRTRHPNHVTTLIVRSHSMHHSNIEGVAP